MTPSIDANRLVIIALTTPLGLPAAERNDIAPLSPTEWRRVVDRAENEGLNLSELPRLASPQRLRLCAGNEALAHRLSLLSDRIDDVRNAVRDLEQRGIWVLTNIDTWYPSQWRSRLGSTAPPTLFGVGNSENLSRPSVGIVGSRDIGPELVRVAGDLGAAAEHEPFVVVSGGARGTDRCAVEGVLEVGGRALAIVPDQLQRDRVGRLNLGKIEAGHLTMVTAVHPDSAFTVGNAMNRNRLIYAHSQLTIVVSTSGDGGGTWAGATANLKQRWAPLAVWTGDHAPEANHRLAALGAFGFAEIPRSRSELAALVRAAGEHMAAAKLPTTVQLGIPGFSA